MNIHLHHLLARADQLDRVDALLRGMGSRLVGLPSPGEVDAAAAMLAEANALLDRIQAVPLTYS